jgi:2-dehydro-3-deoxygluconokinase
MNKIQNRIVDSTGAGDGFNAAYISEFVTTQNAVKSLKAGHNMGSKIVMKKGAIIL